MRAARISGAEAKPLGAPDNWTEETHGHCQALFIRREEISGVHFMRSAWDAEANEAHLMLAGAKLVLGVAGHAHPVVHMTVGDLPSDFEPVMTARRFSDLHGKAMVRVEILYPHAGGRRGFCEIEVEHSLAEAVAVGIVRVETLAREKGWID